MEVYMIFFFNIGFSGAPGSFPNFIFFCLLIPRGKKINSDNHQITK